MDFVNIVNRINDIADKKNVNGAQVGALLGLKKSPLTDWKNQKSKPTLEQIIRICEYFAVSADYILFGNANNPPPDLTESERDLFNLIHPLGETDKIKVTGVVEQYLSMKYPLVDVQIEVPEPLDLRGIQLSRVSKTTTKKPQ